MTRSITEWCRDAHALAVEKGWHSRECPRCYGHGTDPHNLEDEHDPCSTCYGTGQIPVDHKSPTRIGARLALIHSEISEALECVRKGEMELYYCDPIAGCVPGHHCPTDCTSKPEGLPIELADVFLRLCEFAESVGVTLPNLSQDKFSGQITDCSDPEQVAAWLNDMHNDLAVNNALTACKALLVDLFGLSSACGFDLLSMAEIKHSYNGTRPARHGGKAL